MTTSKLDSSVFPFKQQLVVCSSWPGRFCIYEDKKDSVRFEMLTLRTRKRAYKELLSNLPCGFGILPGMTLASFYSSRANTPSKRWTWCRKNPLEHCCVSHGPVHTDENYWGSGTGSLSQHQDTLSSGGCHTMQICMLWIMPNGNSRLISVTGHQQAPRRHLHQVLEDLSSHRSEEEICSASAI